MKRSDVSILRWFCIALVVISDAKKPDVINAPRKLSAKVLSPSSVRVKWRDPDIKKAGQGQGRMYVVQYGSGMSKESLKTVFTPHRRLTLSDLQLGVAYNITVRVITSKTEGPWSKPLKVTITDKEHSPHVQVKKLTTKVISATSVQLSWRIENPANLVIEHIAVSSELSSGGSRRTRFTLPGNASSHVVKGLKPFTEYIFTVKPMTKFGSAKQEQVLTRTSAHVPTKPPRSLRLRVLNSTVIVVRWQAPPFRSRKGPLTSYLIQYKPQASKKKGILTKETKVNTRVYRIEGVQKGQTYKVRLAASNANGVGPYSKWKSVSVTNNWEKSTPKKRGGRKDNGQRKKGSKEKNRKDGQEQNKKDKVEERKRKNRTDEVTTISMPEEKGDVHFEGELVNTMETEMETLENTTVPSDQQSTTPSESPSRLPSPPEEIKATNLSPTTVQLAWNDPTSLECCPVLAFGVDVRNLKGTYEKKSVTGDRTILLTGLEPNTKYSVKITTINTKGRSLPSQPLAFQTAIAVAPIINEAKATRAVLGKTTNLICKAYGEELPTFEWLVKGTSTQDFVNVTEASWTKVARKLLVTSSALGYNMTTSSLQLINVTEETEREYACVAKNSAGSDRKTISLVIDEPPSILSTRGMSVKVGTAAQLECAVKGRPLPKVAWIHVASSTVYEEGDQHESAVNNYVSSLSVEPNIRHSFLVIERTSPSEKGSYTCLATSELGSKEALVSLDVLVPLPPPVRKIQAISLSPSRVSVNWLPPLNYPYAVRYYQVSFRDSQGVQPGIIQTTRVGAELSSLHPNTTYYIGVTAATEHGLGENGLEETVTTLSNIGLEPVEMTVNSIGSENIEINWKSPSAVRPMYIRGYNLYLRPLTDSNVKRYFIRGHDINKFVIDISELGETTQYDLRMSTLTTWGFEAFTAWTKFFTQQRKLPPNPVRDFSAVSIKPESMLLSWREPKVKVDVQLHPESNQILSYSIEYKATSRPWNRTVHENGASERQLQLNGLEPDTMYMIQIKVMGPFGASEPVYLNAKTKPLPPTMVQKASARAISSTKIHLQWTAPKRGPVTRYHIRYWRPGHKDKQSAWMAGSYRNYIAGSLKKNSNYRFEVIPYNGDLLGEGIVIFSNTLSDRPDGPPLDVKMVAVNATTLKASWSPPDPESTNGKITGYKLVLKAKNGRRMANFVVAGDRRNFTFLNMQISNGYKLRMAAATINGTGVFSPAVDMSYSQEPKVPASPEHLMIKPAGTALTLVWEEPRFTGSPILGYIVGYGQFIPDVFRSVLDNTELTHTIKNLKPDSEYIVSVRAFNAIGESKPSFRLTRTKPPPAKPIPLESPMQLSVLAQSPTSLLASWIDPLLVKFPTLEDKRFYQLRYSSIDGEAYSYVNTSDPFLLLAGLERSTIYETSVRVVRGNESSDWSLTAVNSTEQQIPGGPPTRIMTSSVSGQPTLLYLNWSEPEQSNGNIEGYIIFLSHDPSLDSNQWIVLKTQQRQVTIRDLTPHIPYYLKLQARNQAGYGPLSRLVVHVPASDEKSQPIIVSVSGIHGNESTTTEVVWKAPEAPLGLITGYMIYYTKANSRLYSDWLIQFERGLDGLILGLEFNTTYLIKVRARYSDVSGPFSDTINYTTPEGLQKRSFSGESKDAPPDVPTTERRMDQRDKEISRIGDQYVPSKDSASRVNFISDTTSGPRKNRVTMINLIKIQNPTKIDNSNSNSSSQENDTRENDHLTSNSKPKDKNKPADVENESEDTINHSDIQGPSVSDKDIGKKRGSGWRTSVNIKSNGRKNSAKNKKNERKKKRKFRGHRHGKKRRRRRKKQRGKKTSSFFKISMSPDTATTTPMSSTTDRATVSNSSED